MWYAARPGARPPLSTPAPAKTRARTHQAFGAKAKKADPMLGRRFLRSLAIESLLFCYPEGYRYSKSNRTSKGCLRGGLATLMRTL